jgi:excinuclease ABC subunit B
LQQAYNEEHGITPETVKRGVRAGIDAEIAARERANEAAGVADEQEYVTREYVAALEKEMLEAADALEFERAAELRDQVEALREQIGKKTTVADFECQSRKSGRGRGRGKRGARDGSSTGRSRVPKPER